MGSKGRVLWRLSSRVSSEREIVNIGFSWSLVRRFPGEPERRFAAQQRSLCVRVGAAVHAVGGSDLLGASSGVSEGRQWPLHGLRLMPEGGTSGWYLWTGDHDPNDPDFFAPIHAKHIFEARLVVVPYLGLPPGWRFLIAPGYEDIWFDREALDSPG
ncbi:immunity protein Imm33 domain-containing protein [Streptomyces coryli]|uniref:immunity protein Imm33 domain-containing protein n=1 Tax=Streptomyces coryli TaxID=1128680 RepID=UPI003B834769